MRSALIVAVLAMLGATAQETGGLPSAEVLVRPSDVKWMDGPATLPRGAKVAVLSGDPSKAGLFVMRIKMPADYKIMPHSHPGDEHVTVISGALFVSRGDAFDPQKAKELSEGSYALLPGRNNHFAFTKSETIVQLNSLGPWGITYANPADDPRQEKK
ncbi:MAG TPA: cupin domain-containing protein [Planctomycetota bacterium]|nr:cupin domain-containing protein [Planctomycetota bacterium]